MPAAGSSISMRSRLRKSRMANASSRAAVPASLSAISILSRAGESRRPLLEERSRALRRIARRNQDAKLRRLEHERVIESHLQPTVDGVDAGTERERRVHEHLLNHPRPPPHPSPPPHATTPPPHPHRLPRVAALPRQAHPKPRPT